MAVVPIQVLALGITLFCIALTIFLDLLPIIIKFLRFTGLWLPIITMIVLCLIKVPENFEAIFIKCGIGFWIVTLVIAVFLFLKNIIRLFKSGFAYSEPLKRNKAGDDANTQQCSRQDMIRIQTLSNAIDYRNEAAAKGRHSLYLNNKLYIETDESFNHRTQQQGMGQNG